MMLVAIKMLNETPWIQQLIFSDMNKVLHITQGNFPEQFIQHCFEKQDIIWVPSTQSVDEFAEMFKEIDEDISRKAAKKKNKPGVFSIPYSNVFDKSSKGDICKNWSWNRKILNRRWG